MKSKCQRNAIQRQGLDLESWHLAPHEQLAW